MHPLIKLLGIVLVAIAVLALFVGLERWLRRPGLAYLLMGVCALVGASLGLADGQRLLPFLFAVEALGCFYFAHWRRTEARKRRIDAAEA